MIKENNIKEYEEIKEKTKIRTSLEIAACLLCSKVATPAFISKMVDLDELDIETLVDIERKGHIDDSDYEMLTNNIYNTILNKDSEDDSKIPQINPIDLWVKINISGKPYDIKEVISNIRIVIRELQSVNQNILQDITIIKEALLPDQLLLFTKMEENIVEIFRFWLDFKKEKSRGDQSNNELNYVFEYFYDTLRKCLLTAKAVGLEWHLINAVYQGPIYRVTTFEDMLKDRSSPYVSWMKHPKKVTQYNKSTWDNPSLLLTGDISVLSYGIDMTVFNNLNLGQGEEVLYPMLSYDSELLEEYIKKIK